MNTKELIEAVKKERRIPFQDCNDCEYGTHNGEVIEKLKCLAELEDKIEQGTLIELPCKVGDRVYVIADGIWHCQEVWQFRYDSCGLSVKTVGCYPYDFEWDKTAFLTREEAEKRLKEIQE